MALINCPECSKEISDKVLACPNCGFPMVENEGQTQKVEISAVKLKMDKTKKKKIVMFMLISLILLSIFAVGYLANKKAIEEEYNSSITLLKAEMLKSSIISEDLLNLTSRVWSDAIYENYDIETYHWTSSLYGFYDFNTALKNLFADSTVKKNVEEIKKTQNNVSEIMKELNEPPKSYERVYDTILELHVAYQGVTDLAINPQGNLSTFNQNSSEKINKFLELYKKMDTILPEA